ncbi:MAG: hypothetical protein RMJ17_00165 [Candidatus Aenigmarchaeota archaeon]|nr:hypothetical protein [Candidatus Aenigmarchaeota archaeon]MDW8149006.1 hypothetical protein [Candidatus Aenigmarchaeota archaeon]
MKTQAAFEYFIVVSFFVLVLAPYIIYLNQVASSYREDKELLLASDSLNKLGRTIDWVGFQGEPAKISTILTIPENVVSMNFTKNMIIWKVKSRAGISDISYETKFNVSLNITKRGDVKIVVEAIGNNIFVYGS